MSTSPLFASPQCFAGHKGAVIDITAFGHDSSTIITSSEDKTLRLWDLRTGKTRQCITGFGESPINIIKYTPYDSFRLFGMTDDSILSFDLRHSAGLLVRDSHTSVYSIAGSSLSSQQSVEDVNDEQVSELSSFTIHPKENVHLLAVGDDDGTVTVVDSRTGEVSKRLTRVHSNVIGAVAFQPNSQSYLCSGGFDSLFCCWDFARGRPSGDIVDFSKEQMQQQQMANPPFVHDLLYKDGGRKVVSALGDGSLRVLRYVAKQGFVCAGSASEAHGGMATSVCDYFMPPTGGGVEAGECVLSAGIDRYIRGWRLTNTCTAATTALESAGESQVARQLSSKNNKKKNKKKNKGERSTSQQPAQSSVLPSGVVTDAYSFEPLFSIEHKEKINAITYVMDPDLKPANDHHDNIIINSTNADQQSNDDNHIDDDSTDKNTRDSCCTGAGSQRGIAVADVTCVWKLYKMQG
jgi:WD40 repeat protein